MGILEIWKEHSRLTLVSGVSSSVGQVPEKFLQTPDGYQPGIHG